MSHLKVCRICLRTETKMYTYDKFQLKYIYEEIMALKVNDNDGLPQTFCYECATMLHKLHRFKEKCCRGQRVLRELQWNGNITYEAISKVDRQSKNLLSPFSIISLKNKTKGYTVKDCNISVKEENHNIDYDFYCSDYSKDSEQDINITKEKINKEAKTFTDITPYSPVAIVDVKKENIALKSVEIKVKQKNVNYSLERKKVKKSLNMSKWKMYTLTEEQALSEFRSKADDPKYVSAPHKCTDCLKGFSKKEMLHRHIKMRHHEGIGKFECWFCRMRYKWNCDLRKHVLQHYQKFKCLQCDLVSMQEHTAILHQDFHSGVLKECVHCDMKFKHLSTYYTHLRTHRSDYLCTLCGVSFVSEAGLHQHKKVIHIDDTIESPDDDEDVNTFCDRCNMWFDTRKAYEEHMFHSAMHVRSDQNSPVQDTMATKKVLSKTQRAKIMTTLRTMKKSEGAALSKSIRKRRKKLNKRLHRKPMTCYQCGQHFETQAACMKHHYAEHPRTSFHPPADRYICEICGASLAPGSIAVHLNIHTRETLFTCDTCGRQFHTSIGLKRHLVTHTGEKRFMCTKCDKRFTQSNSLKLHFKTSHLKQPYPKRIRQKKEKPQKPNGADVSTTVGDSDRPPPEPELPGPLLGIEPVPNAVPIPDDNVQYMRL